MRPAKGPSLPALAAAVFALTPVLSLAQSRAGGEFQVNTYTTDFQMDPTVSREPDGDFVIVWHSVRPGGLAWGVSGQRYDASGAARGGEFAINTYTTAFQDLPWVAADRQGRFVVAWNRAGIPPGMPPADVAVRRFAGAAPLGAEFIANTYTTSTQSGGRVAAAPSGDFVIVWDSRQGADFTEVFGQRFDRTGQPRGAEFQVNTEVAGYQRYPAVAADPASNFVVVWTGHDGSFPNTGIFARRFDSAGPLGLEFAVNSQTTGLQANPAVAVAANGSFVAVWDGADQDGSDYGVFGQRFDADGTPAGDEFQVNTYTTGFQGTPAVAADSVGNFVVTWATRATQDGSSSAVMARRYDRTGAPRSPEFIVNTYTTSYQNAPQVASDPSGNFVVTWRSYGQDGSAAGVFAQRFGGLHPRALAVDTGPGPTQDGNGVLEPGEGVNVVPRWQNLSGAPQTFAGTIDGISAPPGCIQVLLDETGNYGTVPDGATAFCIDCYRVLAWSTGRCQQHWDISMAERITPDTQGQVKVWALHVGESFTDVPDTSSFYKFVETLLHHDITGGCSATEYCPSGSTTREQMVVFVLLTKEGTGYAPPACVPPNMFDDVPETSPFCRWVEEAARRGMAVGCSANPPLFCPQQPVTREQMSVLLLRTLDPTLNPPACVPGGERFADVPASSPFCRWIEELARRGVVGGCSTNPPLFCPASAVTREQMAVFLSVTFGLALYGP